MLTRISSSLVIGIFVVVIVGSILFLFLFCRSAPLGYYSCGNDYSDCRYTIFLPLITDPLNSSGYRGNEKSESFGVESTCLGDSIVYERPFFFIGVPFIIIALGGIFSKHESIFSIAYENGTTLVLYPGVCFVSKDDKISIRGKWHRGKKARNTWKCRCCRQD
ncbi:hypothetical protein [Methanosarcina barkeri]|uniref:hypothetical protein n=1 Tax=Methanosarcina barkeri TaxID=2208 RepID=UPI000B1B6AC6|nr:hypothetical protein [Methanosarcina barkeri]